MPESTPGDAKYKFGSPEELANRHPDARHPKTESSFTQIKPATSGSPAINDTQGSTKNNRANIK